VGETFDLLLTLWWMKGLHLSTVHFKLDFKREVNSFHDSKQDDCEFVTIISSSWCLFNTFYKNFHVKFIKRHNYDFAQVIVTVHILT
jgi:hypothetical protein